MTDGYYFSIRVLVTHPSMSVTELTEVMGDQPDQSREASAASSAFWSRVGETKGNRAFFSELSDVVSWLEGRGAGHLRQVLGTGGDIQVIVQLPGDRNTGDTWNPRDMARAAALGVSLGVEVFPQIRGVTSDA